MSQNDTPEITAPGVQSKPITGEVLPTFKPGMADAESELGQQLREECTCMECTAPDSDERLAGPGNEYIMAITADVKATVRELEDALRALLGTDSAVHPAMWAEVADMLATLRTLWRDYNRRWGQYVANLHKKRMDDWKAKLQHDIVMAAEAGDSGRTASLLQELVSGKFKTKLPSMGTEIHDMITHAVNAAKVVAEYDQFNLSSIDLSIHAVLDFDLSRAE